MILVGVLGLFLNRIFILNSVVDGMVEQPKNKVIENKVTTGKVIYEEPEDLVEINNIFVKDIRNKLMNNLHFVVKQYPPNCPSIDRVLIERYTKEDYSTQITCNNGTQFTFDSLFNKFILIKFDATFNSDSFLWDESIISWYVIETDPQLVTSTLDFWYSIQIKEGNYKGLIPREVRTNEYFDHVDNLIYFPQEANSFSFTGLDTIEVNNPFLLGRLELELFKQTNDKSRLEVSLPKLIEYYQWVEKNRKKIVLRDGEELVLYNWSNMGSGMDNSPRCENIGYTNCGFSDLIAQQASLAKEISYLSTLIGDTEIAKKYMEIYRFLGKQIRNYYLDGSDGFVYDLDQYGSKIKDGGKTIAFVWSLYSGVLTKEQSDVLVRKYLTNPNEFGGVVSFPSVSRSSQFYNKNGNYWRGGVFPPLVWISYISLIDNGYSDIADIVGTKINDLMEKLYNQDRTLYEYYSPDATGGLYPGYKPLAKPDFFGWGALPVGIYVRNNTQFSF